jgi:DNA-binding MarR family transcriptional regulator
MSAPPDAVAALVIDVVPLIMRAIRTRMRQYRAGLSLPQFRVLAFLDQAQGASLSEVAQHIGVTLPSMSKMVDGLVEQRLVSREFASTDRRRITLALTPHGRALFNAARTHTRAYLAHLFESLPSAKRAILVDALETLRPLFASEREAMDTDATS